MTSLGTNWRPAPMPAGLDGRSHGWGNTQLGSSKFASPYEVATQGGVQSPYEIFFGPPRAPIPKLPRNVENYDLPDAYVGNNIYLSQLLIRNITSAETFFFQILPWTSAEGRMKIIMNKWTFNDHLLDRVPEEGVPRLLTSNKTQQEVAVIRWGIGLIVEMGFYSTPDGKREWAGHIKQIENAIVETNCLGVAEALLNSKAPKSSRAEIYETGLTVREFEDILKAENAQWGILQKTKFGGTHLANNAKTVLGQRGVVPNTIVVPNGSLGILAQRPELTEFPSSGKRSTPDDTSGARRQFQGMRVFESRAIRVGDGEEPDDPFFRDGVHGGRLLMLPDYGEAEPEHYSHRMRRILAFDEGDDDYVPHDIANVIRNCGLWDPDTGKLTVTGGAVFGAMDVSLGDWSDKHGHLDYMVKNILSDDDKVVALLRAVEHITGVRPHEIVSNSAGPSSRRTTPERNLPYLNFQMTKEVENAIDQLSSVYDDATGQRERMRDMMKATYGRELAVKQKYGFFTPYLMAISRTNGRDLRTYVVGDLESSGDGDLARIVPQTGGRGKLLDFLAKQISKDMALERRLTDVVRTSDDFIFLPDGEIKKASLPYHTSNGVSDSARIVIDKLEGGETVSSKRIKDALGDVDFMQTDFESKLYLDYFNSSVDDALTSENIARLYNEFKKSRKYMQFFSDLSKCRALSTNSSTSGRPSKFVFHTDKEGMQVMANNNTEIAMKRAGMRRGEVERRMESMKKLAPRILTFISTLGPVAQDRVEDLVNSAIYSVVLEHSGSTGHHFNAGVPLDERYGRWKCWAAMVCKVMDMYEKYVGIRSTATNATELETALAADKDLSNKNVADLLEAFSRRENAGELSRFLFVPFQTILERTHRAVDSAAANMAMLMDEQMQNMNNTVLRVYGALPQASRENPSSSKLRAAVNANIVAVVSETIEMANSVSIYYKARMQVEAQHTLQYMKDRADARNDAQQQVIGGGAGAAANNHGGRIDNLEQIVLHADRSEKRRGVESLLHVLPVADFRSWEYLLDNNVPVPLGFIGFLPHMMWNAGTAWVGVRGRPLGATFISNPDFQVGKNVTQKMIFGNFTAYFKSVVVNPELMHTVEDVYVRSYVGGADSRYWAYTRPDRARYMDGNIHGRDIFWVAVPPDWKPRSKFTDITGCYDPSIITDDEDQIAHYPTARAYAEFWGWAHAAGARKGDYFNRPPARFNTVCAQSHQMNFRHTGNGQGKHDLPVLNCDCRGIDIFPGSARWRNSQMAFAEPAEYRQSKTLRVTV